MGYPPRIGIPFGDPLRTYTPAEEELLTLNLRHILERVHAGEFSRRPINVELLEELHRGIFAGVRIHAGRCRGPGVGSEYLTFGPHRSEQSMKVPVLLQQIFETFSKALASLEDNLDHAEFEETAIRNSAWLHAEIIRVHPFEDGNGRTSRALMNLVLVRLGLRPIPIEAPKQEYLACLNHYYRTQQLEPFLDLCLRLYPDL